MKPKEIKTVEMKSTELLVLELFSLSRIYRVQGYDDTADVLAESADRLNDLSKIAEHYRRKAEKSGNA